MSGKAGSENPVVDPHDGLELFYVESGDEMRTNYESDLIAFR